MVNIIKKTVSGLLLLLAMCFWAQKTSAQPGVSVSIQTFYDELEPYGQWIDDPELGYVWAPDAGPDFKPYATNGHWAATEFGNTWVSDYDWGWAAFHYGRWRFANDYGWEWIPGTEWGPAWVNWRTGGDYYGWAPLGPGINIDLSFGANYYQPDNYWVFAPRRYVYEPNIYRYYLPANRNVNIIHNTTIINNVYVNNSRRYIAGPRPDDVRRYTNTPVNIYNINDSRRPGETRIRNNTLNIYRPQIASKQNNDNRPEPNRVINRGSYNRNQGFGNVNNNNRNQNLNNGRQPGNQGNPQNAPSNNNNGFGRNNTNAPSGNQLPQRVFPNQNQTNPNSNNTINGHVPGNTTNPNTPSNPVGGRSNPSNQPAQIPSSQPNYNWRQSRDFDHNGTRNDFPIQQNQNQQNQNQQNQNQQMQQNQQQMQQRQLNQQRQQQNQQNQQRNQQEMQQRQQNQQRQQEMQQRQQNQQRPQPQQQQRPARQETPEPNNRG